MLFECAAPDELLRHWVSRSLPRRVMSQWLRQGAAPEDPQPRWFTDDRNNPQTVLRLHGLACWIHGPAPAVAAALADLRAGRLTGATPWPDEALRAAWEAAGQRELHLSRSPWHALRSARALGWRDPPGEPQPHYQAYAWYVTGRPRFAHLVQHPCRVIQGEELWPVMQAGADRDEVNYRRACLRQGPSFVCEVPSSAAFQAAHQADVGWKPALPLAVCTSFTHLGGPMGGIYTPEEHRGRGYGKSLTALQVDTMLALQGLAVASIRLDNAPSYRMLMALGGKHLRGALVWTRLLWE